MGRISVFVFFVPLLQFYYYFYVTDVIRTVFGFTILYQNIGYTNLFVFVWVSCWGSNFLPQPKDIKVIWVGNSVSFTRRTYGPSMLSDNRLLSKEVSCLLNIFLLNIESYLEIKAAEVS